MKAYLIIMSLLAATAARAQIGQYRNELGIGFGGGYTMSSVGFNPHVPQKQLGGISLGVAARYTCEKYFNTVCAIVAELNMTQAGWKEDLLTVDDQPVVNAKTGLPEEFSRRLTYVQMPLLARLGWGRERSGVQAFVQLGPQLGYFISDKATSNFDYSDRNYNDRVGAARDAVQDTLPIARKFDYGIAVGAGIELSRRRLGHLMLEGRYYYGLGDIYGNSKRDYFGRSNLSTITVKLTYLFDIKKTNNNKIR